MSYRELSMVEVKEILRLWANGRGVRQIARATGVSRNSVRRYIQAAQDGRAPLVAETTERCRGRLPSHVLDDDLVERVAASIQPGAPRAVGAARLACREHIEQIREWATECDAPKIRKLLQAEGVDVSLRTLQRFMSDELQPQRSTVRLQDPDPGVLEFDFLKLGSYTNLDGEEVTVHAALLTASVSRHQFLWPCHTQTRDDVIAALEAAWDFFSGVFPVLLPDNLKAVVQKPDAVNPKFNDWFFEYAQSRGFEIDPARVRKPRDKARVERQVRYVRRSFFGGEGFRELESMRSAARAWCLEEAGVRVHATTRRKPVEHFAETDALTLLPAPTQPYDQPVWSSHKVGHDHAIVVQHALYSVPYQVQGNVRVYTDSKTVKVYHRRQLVKIHLRVPSGHKQLDPADAPPGKAELVDRSAASIFAAADAQSPIIGAYARRLAPDPKRRFGDVRRLYRLLTACERYGVEAVDEACARALELDVIDIKRIESMLAKGLEQRRNVPPPRRPPPHGELLRFERPASAFSLVRETP